MRLGRTAVVHFVSRVGASLAGFVATFVIARELGPEPLGIYTIGVGLLYVTSIPLNAVTTAVSKRMSEGSEQGAYLSAGAFMIGAITVVAAAVILGLRGVVESYVGADVALLLAALVAGQALYATVQAVLTGERRVEVTGASEVVERVVRTALQIGFIVAGYSVAGLFLGYVGSLFVAAVLTVVVVRTRPRRPTRAQFASLWRFAKHSWFGPLKARSFGWMDTIVLALFVAPGLIGVYEVAWTLSNVVALLGGSIRRVLFPEMSNLSTGGDFERIRHFLDEAFVYTGVLAIPGLFGAVVVGDRVLAIYRPTFSQGATVLGLLIVAQIASMFGDQLLSAIDAVDRPDVTLRINGLFVVLNLVLNVVLVWTIGWVGAAIATVLSTTIVLVASFVALDRIVGRPPIPVQELGREVVAALVMAAVVAAVEPFVPTGHYLTVALVSLGATVYGLVLLSLSARIRQKVRYVLPDTWAA
jgi:O-antigen/teichoic acid export membrane protein